MQAVSIRRKFENTPEKHFNVHLNKHRLLVTYRTKIDS